MSHTIEHLMTSGIGVILLQSKLELQTIGEERWLRDFTNHPGRCAATLPLKGRTSQINGSLQPSSGTNTAAKAASLLSRRAATDRSHGRQPVGRCGLELSPGGAKDSREICRRSAALIGCASRVILDSPAFQRRGGCAMNKKIQFL